MWINREIWQKALRWSDVKVQGDYVSFVEGVLKIKEIRKKQFIGSDSNVQGNKRGER